MKKLLVLLLVTCGVLVMAFRLFQALRPNAKLIVGRDTTFVDSPLDENGVPDFARAFDERLSKGVKPESNGAVELWQAMGPQDEISRADYELMCEHIGAELADGPHFVPLYGDETKSKLVETLSKQFGDSEIMFWNLQSDVEEVADEIVSACWQYPWRKNDLPVLADWLTSNEQAFELLERSATKPLFYSPAISHLNDPSLPLMQFTLEHNNLLRFAARGLAARCMNRLATRLSLIHI